MALYMAYLSLVVSYFAGVYHYLSLGNASYYHYTAIE